MNEDILYLRNNKLDCYALKVLRNKGIPAYGLRAKAFILGRTDFCLLKSTVASVSSSLDFFFRD